MEKVDLNEIIIMPGGPTEFIVIVMDLVQLEDVKLLSRIKTRSVGVWWEEAIYH
jgi:hypothetical protein